MAEPDMDFANFTRDITSILLALGDELDLDYLESWAVRLGLISLWREVQGRTLDG